MYNGNLWVFKHLSLPLSLSADANVFISSLSALSLSLYIWINSCASQPGLILFPNFFFFFFWGGGGEGMSASEWRQRDYFSGCMSDQTTWQFALCVCVCVCVCVRMRMSMHVCDTDLVLLSARDLKRFVDKGYSARTTNALIRRSMCAGWCSLQSIIL